MSGRPDRSRDVQGYRVQAAGNRRGLEVSDENVAEIQIILQRIEQVVRLKLHAESLGQDIYAAGPRRVRNQQQFSALLNEPFHQVHFSLRVTYSGEYNQKTVGTPQLILQQRQSGLYFHRSEAANDLHVISTVGYPTT